MNTKNSLNHIEYFKNQLFIDFSQPTREAKILLSSQLTEFSVYYNMTQQPYWFDTHCHPHYSPLFEDIDSVLTRATEAQVLCIICVSTDFPDREKILKLIKKNTQVQLFRSIGIHPLTVKKYSLSEISTGLESDDLDAVVSVGETGLDNYRDPLDTHQIDAFQAHLRFGERKSLPIIMHARGTVEQEAMGLIRDSTAVGVAHCFGGSWQFAEFLLSHGWYISFSGNITYKKSDELRQILLNTPVDRILIETDAPFLPPQLYRGHPNEPAYVSQVGDFISKLLKIDRLEFMRISTANAARFFKLKSQGT